MQKKAWTAQQMHEMGSDMAHLAAKVMKVNKGNLSHLPTNTRKEVYHAFEHGARTGAGMRSAGTKVAAFVGPVSDLAGLGMLAVPGVKTLRDPHASAKEKNHAKWESAGLGTLAAGVAVNDRHEIAEGAKHFLHAKGFGNKLRAVGRLAVGNEGLASKAMNIAKHAGAPMNAQMMRAFRDELEKISTINQFINYPGVKQTTQRIGQKVMTTAERMAARKADMARIAAKHNPVHTLPAGRAPIHLGA